VTVAGQPPSPPYIYVVGSGPGIISLNPASGPVGTVVTINGLNFGTTTGSVKFNGLNATNIAWTSANVITATVPPGASTGNVVVTTASGAQSNGMLFTVTPKISILSPSQAPAGGTIYILGSGFGAAQGNSTVALGNTTLSVVGAGWSDNNIQVQIPANATGTANIVVTVGTNASNGMPFTVVATFGCN
jgi:hypothetical protein